MLGVKAVGDACVVQVGLPRAVDRVEAIKDTIHADVVEDAEYYTEEDTLLKANSVDLILGSGALTTSVLDDKAAAIKVLEKCHRYLKPDGFLVLAGHGYSLVNSSDFTKLGFRLVNATLARYTRSFYIVQK